MKLFTSFIFLRCVFVNKLGLGFFDNSQVHIVNMSNDLCQIFQIKYNKTYQTVVDELKRSKIFNKTLHFIYEHNRKYELGTVSFTIGINQFADMSNDEYKQLILSKSIHLSVIDGDSSKCEMGKNIDMNLIPPTNWDWRDYHAVTGVKNQGLCGSCWAFSAVAAIESHNIITNNKTVLLSEQNLIDCSTKNKGCNGGLTDYAFDYVVKNGGIDKQNVYRYRGSKSYCRYSPFTVGARLTGYEHILQNETVLQQYVAFIGPVSIGIDASGDSFKLYKHGIYVNDDCQSTADCLNHAVLLIGYGVADSIEYWIIKNSWDTTWGENGFGRLARNRHNQCGVATAASYPCVMSTASTVVVNFILFILVGFILNTS